MGFSFLAFNSIAGLPESIAIHFDTNGSADNWIDRDTYRVFALLTLVTLPLLLVWLMAGLPRLTKGRGQVPDCEYWFADNRRQQTEAFLLQHACWLGTITVAVVYGVHILIVRANGAHPPTLDSDRALAIAFMFLVGLAWWTASFFRHFRRG